jgi:hypothetical protein
MAVKIKSETDLLNIETRKALIDEFAGAPNQRRKAEAFKAYECLKDKTINYVYDLLTKQFEPDTVAEMQYAMTNVSILRKVIDKLAKVYANGVKRTMPEKESAKPQPLKKVTLPVGAPYEQGAEDQASLNDKASTPPQDPNAVDDALETPAEQVASAVSPETQQIEDAAKYLDMNKQMKKTNRYFRTFKNCLVYVRPKQNEDQSFEIGIEVLPPHHYDVVESPLNAQEALAVIISDYVPTRKPLYAIGDAALAGRTGYRESHVVDAPIQNTPNTGIVQTAQSGGSGEDKKTYIWWTKNFHFTTNSKGEVISGPDISNPVVKLPFVNFAGDQDNCYWAEGGSDLVDASIKINVDITNTKSIGVSQGYGQMYMTGKNLPKSIKVGPTHAVQIEYDKDTDPVPDIGFLSSNPPLGELQKLIEMQVALMLTTNNLSTSGFSLSLQGGKDFASGIALMIDKSESIDDVNEQAEVFIKKEPEVWVVARDWFKIYSGKGLLSDKAKVVKIPEAVAELNLQFPSPKQVVSEKEQIENLKARKDLGLNTEVELIMRDDPSLTEEEATEKLAKIKAEKMANMDNAVSAMMDQGGGDNGDQSQESGGVGKQDGNNAGPGFGKPPGQNPVAG